MILFFFGQRKDWSNKICRIQFISVTFISWAFFSFLIENIKTESVHILSIFLIKLVKLNIIILNWTGQSLFCLWYALFVLSVIICVFKQMWYIWSFLYKWFWSIKLEYWRRPPLKMRYFTTWREIHLYVCLTSEETFSLISVCYSWKITTIISIMTFVWLFYTMSKCVRAYDWKNVPVFLSNYQYMIIA